MPGLAQLPHDPRVVEHVGIHQQNRTAAEECLAKAPNGHRALTIAWVEHGPDVRSGADRFELGGDQIGPVAHADDDLVDAQVLQDGEMACEQRLAADAQQRLRRLAPRRAQPVADTRGEDDCLI